MKSGIKKRMKKMRKRGAITIEFLVAIPLLVLMLMIIINLMTYLNAHSTISEATHDASRNIAMQMRGMSTEDMKKNGIPETVFDEAVTRIERSLTNNNFVEIFEGDDKRPTESLNDETGCYNMVSETDGDGHTNRNVVCVFTRNEEGSERGIAQIVVRVKSDFKMIGSFLPYADDNFFLQAESTTQVESSGRFNYN